MLRLAKWNKNDFRWVAGLAVTLILSGLLAGCGDFTPTTAPAVTTARPSAATTVSTDSRILVSGDSKR
ncbi:MAG TPA: hypothetical protein VH186_13605 [Chloroflexia bacterium]|nr:hypothetical protein [Chloroflexia bacterium]